MHTYTTTAATSTTTTTITTITTTTAINHITSNNNRYRFQIRGNILHTRHQHLRKHSICSVSGVSQRVSQLCFPTDFHRCEIWCAVVCPDKHIHQSCHLSRFPWIRFFVFVYSFGVLCLLFSVYLYLAQDKGGPSKGVFLNNRLISYTYLYLCNEINGTYM